MSGIVTNGLIAYYNSKQGVNGNIWSNIAPDTIGLYDATINGATVMPRGMYFDGIDDYVESNMSSGFFNGSFTVELVIDEMDNPNANDYEDVLFVGIDSNNGYVISVVPNAIEVGYITEHNGHVDFFTDTSYNREKVHVTMVANGRSITVYRNGVSFGNYTIPQSSSIDSEFRLGSYFGDYQPNGIIDGVKLYDRALSPQELLQNFQNGLEVGLETTPVAPSDVTNLSETHTEDSVILTWLNPNEDVFSHVKILKDGIEIANNIVGETYTDLGLTDDTSYTYKIITVGTNSLESDGIEIIVITDKVEVSEPTDGIVKSGLVAYYNSKQGVNGNTWSNIAPNTEGQFDAVISGATVTPEGMYFDGIDDYVEVTIPSLMKGTNATTFEFYLKSDISYAEFPSIIAMENVNMSEELFIYTRLAGRIEAYLFNEEYDTHYELFPNVTNSYQELTHYVIVVDGDEVRGYMNGALVSTNGGNSMFRISNNKLLIGREAPGNWRSSQGVIDGVKLYNRALSIEEVQQNYAVGLEVGLEEDEPEIVPPTNVTNLKESHTDTVVNLSWNNPVENGFSHIKIFRDNVEIVNNLIGESYTDSNLTQNTTYTYRIITVNIIDEESDGAEVTVMTELHPLPPNVLVRMYTDGTVRLKGELIEQENVTNLFDSKGNMYATEFIETEESIFRIGADRTITARKFIEDISNKINNSIPNILHLNGAEYGVYDYTGETNTFSNQNLGVLGTDYHYERQEFLNYIASRGWTIVKLPIRWERIQSTINGNLNTTELGYLRSFMDRCHNAGLKVIIDVHNYGLYYLHESGIGHRKAIGSVELPISAFADLWTRLSSEFHDHPAIFGYALMAEPQSAGGLTSAVWEDASQQAVEAIRQVDIESEIHVSGFSWGSVPHWTSSNSSTPWINDPSGGIIRYEGHHYFDRDSSGSYENPYSSEVADAIGKGFTKDGNKDELITKALYEVQGYVNWLESNNVLGVLGETGWLTNDSDWMFLGEKYLEELGHLNIPVTAWSAGEWTADYYLSLYGGSSPNIVKSLSAQIWEESL